MNNKVKQLVEDKLGLGENDYELGSSFREDLGCDSLDMMEIAMNVEREFNIALPDEDVDKIITVQDLMNYVDSRIK